MDETSEFLDHVQDASPTRDRGRVLDVARGVFYALLRASGPRRCREVADLLPEELETVWKPAFFTCLRENRSPNGPPAGSTFLDLVRRRVPDMDEEEFRGATSAVIDSLRPYLTPGEIEQLSSCLPDELRKRWTAG